MSAYLMPMKLYEIPIETGLIAIGQQAIDLNSHRSNFAGLSLFHSGSSFDSTAPVGVYASMQINSL